MREKTVKRGVANAHPVRRRMPALAAIALLGVALALASCGGQRATGQNATDTGSQVSSASATSQLGDTDTQVQSALSALDTTEISATSADSAAPEGASVP